LLFNVKLAVLQLYSYDENNRIGGVIDSVVVPSALGHGFDYKIGICCFSAKHTTLRRKSNHWLARNQDNVSEWGDLFIHGLLFQWASIIKIQLRVLF